MRTVTPRISSDEVDGRREGFGGAQVKSKELTPMGTGPTVMREGEATQHSVRLRILIHSVCEREYSPIQLSNS
jgi:hypothetical protein